MSVPPVKYKKNLNPVLGLTFTDGKLLTEMRKTRYLPSQTSLQSFPWEITAGIFRTTIVVEILSSTSTVRWRSLGTSAVMTDPVLTPSWSVTTSRTVRMELMRPTAPEGCGYQQSDESGLVRRRR